MSLHGDGCYFIMESFNRMMQCFVLPSCCHLHSSIEVCLTSILLSPYVDQYKTLPPRDPWEDVDNNPAPVHYHSMGSFLISGLTLVSAFPSSLTVVASSFLTSDLADAAAAVLVFFFAGVARPSPLRFLGVLVGVELALAVPPPVPMDAAGDALAACFLSRIMRCSTAQEVQSMFVSIYTSGYIRKGRKYLRPYA